MEQAELFTAEKVRKPRTEEQKKKQREYKRKWFASLPEEKKEKRREDKRKWFASLPEEKKEKRREDKRKWFASLPEEQKEKNRESSRKWEASLDLDGLRLLKIQSMCRRARYRAKKKVLPFNLTVQDIADVWPKDDYCPALRIPLRVRPGNKISTNNSPNLDRIIPRLGYVKGNVVVVSKLANGIMSSARPSEVIKVGKWFDEKYYEVKDKLNV
jgi:hypothetical protein